MAKMVNFTYVHFTTRKLIEKKKKTECAVPYPTPTDYKWHTGPPFLYLVIQRHCLSLEL